MTNTPESSQPGPKTEAGKARSRMNATRHGLAGRVVVLPNEDLYRYHQFCKDIIASLDPKTPIEHEIAQNIANGYWRLKRVHTTEESLLALGHEEGRANFDSAHEDMHAAYAIARTFRAHTQAFATLSIYEQRIQRAIDKHMKQLQELQAARKQARAAELHDALALRAYNKMRDLPYDPAEDGFVCSSADIELEANRLERRQNAWRAAKVGFNYARYQTMAA